MLFQRLCWVARSLRHTTRAGDLGLVHRPPLPALRGHGVGESQPTDRDYLPGFHHPQRVNEVLWEVYEPRSPEQVIHPVDAVLQGLVILVPFPVGRLHRFRHPVNPPGQQVEVLIDRPMAVGHDFEQVPRVRVGVERDIVHAFTRLTLHVRSKPWPSNLTSTWEPGHLAGSVPRCFVRSAASRLEDTDHLPSIPTVPPYSPRFLAVTRTSKMVGCWVPSKTGRDRISIP